MYRLPRGGLTESGKVLLRMRLGQGVAIRQLACEFNVNVKHIRKYLKKISPENIYSLSPEIKKRVKKRRSLVKDTIEPLDRAGVPINGSARKIRGKLKRKGINESSDTVNRDILSLGYTYESRPLSQGLTEVQKNKRVLFAKNWEKLKWDTSLLVFTDEKIFDTNDHRSKMWVAPGQKPVKRQRVHWAPKCHVWGVVGVGYRHLVILPTNSITCVSYIKTLKKVSFPSKCIFQQDGATPHTAKETKAYLENSKMKLLKNWPPN